MTWSIVQADCLDFLRSLEPGSASLVFGSPPYEGARLYLENGEDLGIARDTEAWVAWMVEVVRASLRVCKGLVAFVVEGQTRNYRYSAGPALLMADLHRAGVTLRKPPIFHRVGIPGSGGPDWLRSDTEWVICTTNGGRLVWSDATACGKPPKWQPGGAMSHRLVDGRRAGGRRITSGSKDGDTINGDSYLPPDLANPGNTIQQWYTADEVAALFDEAGDVVHCKVGGGLLGSPLAHENEAPFPEKLADAFVRSFCPPGGIVTDPFSGSGTTAAVAIRTGRRFLGCDIRASQVQLSRKRVESVTPETLFNGV